MSSSDVDRNRQEIALRRFACVSRVEELVRQGVRARHATQQVAQSPPVDIQVAARTLEDWWYLWRKKGFEALKPRLRADRGRSRVLTSAQTQRIIDDLTLYPRIPLKTLYTRWQKEDDQWPSLNTVYRFIRQQELGGNNRFPDPLLNVPTKAFETPMSNDLWMVDFSPGPYLVLAGQKNKRLTQLCLIIDDHSRLVVGAAYHWKADTASFHLTLKDAVLRRGLPHKLYTDRGSPFVCDHSRIVCATLGIRLLHAKPYHAWSKGKVERMFLTLQSDFERALPLQPKPPTDLRELNDQLALWLEGTYHCRNHSSTGQAPQVRFARHLSHPRVLEDPTKIDELFYTHLKRRVRKDGTIRLDNVLYEVDLSLRNARVQLRFDPQRKHPINVFYKDRFCGYAKKVDLHHNSQLHLERNYEKQDPKD